jgi:hypothetical protein
MKISFMTGRLGVAMLWLASLGACSVSNSGPIAAQSAPTLHRYLVERTFEPGALEGLNALRMQKVVFNNSKLGVYWVTSYVNRDRTKTYCVYEGPSEAAVREAAAANQLPVDSMTEISETLTPG